MTDAIRQETTDEAKAETRAWLAEALGLTTLEPNEIEVADYVASLRQQLSEAQADTKGYAATMREIAAKVCESRARSLHEGGQHSAASEAGKCASAIRCAGTPSAVSVEFWESVHRQRALERDAELWRTHVEHVLAAARSATSMSVPASSRLGDEPSATQPETDR